MVPAPILNRLFLFHICKATTTTLAISSGNPNGNSANVTFFKQYTTNIPITAGGNTLPRYCTALGIFLLSEKSKNGIARVIKVVIATNAIITTERQKDTGRLVIHFYLPSFILFIFYSVI